jgi:hypothetical protein
MKQNDEFFNLFAVLLSQPCLACAVQSRQQHYCSARVTTRSTKRSNLQHPQQQSSQQRADGSDT